MNSMPPPEMQMQYSAGALKDGGKLTVWVTIPEKWHVNANEVTDEFLKPSSIVVKAEGIEFGDVVWPKPIKEYNEALELEILTFRGEFKIEIPVKSVADKYDSLGTEATFHYQACDNSLGRQTIHALVRCSDPQVAVTIDIDRREFSTEHTICRSRRHERIRFFVQIGKRRHRDQPQSVTHGVVHHVDRGGVHAAIIFDLAINKFATIGFRRGERDYVEAAFACKGRTILVSDIHNPSSTR